LRNNGFPAAQRRAHIRARPRRGMGDVHARQPVFPHEPVAGEARSCRLVAGKQPAVIGGDHVAALGLGDRGAEIGPAVGPEPRRAAAIEPVQLGLPAQKHAAQDQRGRPPRDGSGHRPAPASRPSCRRTHARSAMPSVSRISSISAIRCWVVLADAGMRARQAAAALIEQHGAVMRRVEEAPHEGAAAAARPAMQHHDRAPSGLPLCSTYRIMAIAHLDRRRSKGSTMGIPGDAAPICPDVRSMPILYTPPQRRQRTDHEHRQPIDPSEVAKFEAMAAEWWDPKGKFKPLHMMNPTRLDYITTQIAAEFGRDLKAARPFEGLRLLDIGCGGGLLSEPMARLGARSSAPMRRREYRGRPPACRTGRAGHRLSRHHRRGPAGRRAKASTWCWRWRSSSMSPIPRLRAPATICCARRRADRCRR
jgi:hypothetical protein